MSNLELKIFQILSKEKINFIQEYQISDFKKGRYRFDFFIPKQNIAIEVHGAQHYEFNSFFHKKRSDFTKAQERDRSKISYCLANKINLYCLPYWEIDNISSFKDICQEKFLARTKFHNDEIYRQQKNRNK